MSDPFESKFISIIKADAWLMDLLRHAQALRLGYWAIAAGAVRSSVWDHLHGFQRKTKPTDIDLIFFDAVKTDAAYEKEIERRLFELEPEVTWEAVNQASIHTYTEDPPYSSIEHAMTRWAETATAVAVYLDDAGELQYYAPHGLDDLMNIVFRPHLVTPRSKEVYVHRIATKNFKAKWPKLTILMPEE